MRRTVLICAAVGGVACGLAGCGGPPSAEGPPAEDITGQVVFTKGGDVAELYGCQGSVEFQCVERPEVHAFGEIREDGTFKLATLEDGVGRAGAIEGTHRVRLNLDDSAKSLVAPQFLSFERSGITVKVPSEQPIEIKVWK
jgi:hypothetical protein